MAGCYYFSAYSVRRYLDVAPDMAGTEVIPMNKTDGYTKLLIECLSADPIKDCAMTDEQIREAILHISENLRGWLTNEDRLCLVAERAELRATLKARGVR